VASSPAPTSGISQLQSLAAGVMGTKVARNAKLTPTPAEVAARPPRAQAPVAFPNDMPLEVATEKAAELTRIIEHLIEARDALLVAAGQPEAVETQRAEDIATEVKLAEKEADRRAVEVEPESKPDKAEAPAPTRETFQERLARLAAAAQASAFTQPAETSIAETLAGTAPMPEVLDGEDSGWTCPQGHGFIDATSPKGRKFRKCTLFDAKECGEFEKQN